MHTLHSIPSLIHMGFCEKENVQCTGTTNNWSEFAYLVGDHNNHLNYFIKVFSLAQTPLLLQFIIYKDKWKTIRLVNVTIIAAMPNCQCAYNAFILYLTWMALFDSYGFSSIVCYFEKKKIKQNITTKFLFDFWSVHFVSRLWCFRPIQNARRHSACSFVMFSTKL